MTDPAVDVRDPIDELAAHYRYLADFEFRDYCALYEHLAQRAADDRDFCALVADMVPRAKIVPVLLFAAVHDLVLADPDSALAGAYRGEPTEAWPVFRRFVLEHETELRATCEARSIQTNEVGRAAYLVPILRAVHERFAKPIAIIEIGPSAGLNLFADRFFIDYGSDTVGDPNSPVRLHCKLVGDGRPPIGEAPTIARRCGIDLAPIDVTDADACRWLEACLWPDVPDRSARLRAAIGLARRDPPDLRQGSAPDLLPGVLEELGHDVTPVVISSWVLAYLSATERTSVLDALDTVGARRDLAAVTLEYPSIAGWIPDARRPAAVGEDRGATLVGLATWDRGPMQAGAVAWCHAHGRWLDWLD